MTTEATFAQRLVAEVPELKPLLDDHLEEQEGQLLPYLLRRDVATWLHARAEVAGLMRGRQR